MGTMTYRGDCPHCFTKSVNFSSKGSNVMVRRDRVLWNLFMVCSNCSGCMVLVIHDPVGQRGPLYTDGNRFLNDEPHIRIVDRFPKIPASEAPDETPEKIAKIYCEAEDNFRAGKYETSGMLLRKTLDLATKFLRGDAAAKREQLYDRIEALRTGGVITDDMSKWAHAVRLDAREAVHDDVELTEYQANDLLQFTKAFLIYSFTLRAMIEMRETFKPPV